VSGHGSACETGTGLVSAPLPASQAELLEVGGYVWPSLGLGKKGCKLEAKQEVREEVRLR
jgi:hypothetical protein